MTARRDTTLKKQPERRIYISRPLELTEKNKEVREFSEKVGRAIKGTGTTRSLGSMAVTLMSAQTYSQVRNNLTNKDRARHAQTFDDFYYGLREVLSPRQPVNFCIHGLGFLGRNARSYRPGAKTTFGLKIDRDGESLLREDLDVIKGYFSDQQLPEPALKFDKLHIAIGEVLIHRLESGKNHDPHIFIPAGVSVPRVAAVQSPIVEQYND